MDPKDLHKMLDLDGKPPGTPTDSGVVVPPPSGTNPRPTPVRRPWRWARGGCAAGGIWSPRANA